MKKMYPDNKLKLVELADLYGRDKRTIESWLQPFKNKIGVRVGQFYNKKQIRLIYSCIGSYQHPSYSLFELAEMYDQDKRLLKIWLQPFEKAIGKRIGTFYNPKQVQIIFEKLDTP